MRKAYESVLLFWIKDEIAAAFEKGMLSEMKLLRIMCERISEGLLQNFSISS